MNSMFAVSLAEARAKAEKMQEMLEEMEERLEDSPLGKQVEAQRQIVVQLRAVEAEAESALRLAALKEHKTTGGKEFDGCKIAMYTVLGYDEGQARNWSMEHNHAELLKLDKRAFEKVAKELKPDFVEITEEARVRIDSDLSRYLEGE